MLWHDPQPVPAGCARQAVGCVQQGLGRRNWDLTWSVLPTGTVLVPPRAEPAPSITPSAICSASSVSRVTLVPALSMHWGTRASAPKWVWRARVLCGPIMARPWPNQHMDIDTREAGEEVLGAAHDTEHHRAAPGNHVGQATRASPGLCRERLELPIVKQLLLLGREEQLLRLDAEP